MSIWTGQNNRCSGGVECLPCTPPIFKKMGRLQTTKRFFFKQVSLILVLALLLSLVAVAEDDVAVNNSAAGIEITSNEASPEDVEVLFPEGTVAPEGEAGVSDADPLSDGGLALTLDSGELITGEQTDIEPNTARWARRPIIPSGPRQGELRRNRLQGLTEFAVIDRAESIIFCGNVRTSQISWR